MRQQCPECGAPTEAAPWCGACGARLSAAPAAEAEGPSRDGSRGRFVAALGVLGLVVVAVLASPDAPNAGPDGGGERGDVAGDEIVLPERAGAGASTTVDPATSAAEAVRAPLWQRREVPRATPGTDVIAAGSDHVVVGDRVVATTGSTATALLGLPAPLRTGAFAPDGRWAIAEHGRLVVGTLGASVASSVALTGQTAPVGTAVAWVEEDPVIPDSAGHLVRLTGDGTVVWRTATPVAPGGPVGARWLAGVRDGGGPVAVALDSGGVVDLPVPALAILDDLVVLRREAVVGRDLRTGRDRWRRPDVGAQWRVVGDTLVAAGEREFVRVDPADGTDSGRVEGAAGIPTVVGVAVLQPARVQLLDWDGDERWTVDLPQQTIGEVVAVDAARVALVAHTEEGSRVVVFRAEDGGVAADAPLRAVASATITGDGEVVALLDDEGSLLTVDAETGRDVAAEPPDRSGTPGQLMFAVRGEDVAVSVGVVSAQGRVGPDTTWTVVLDAPVAVPPVATGTSLVVGLADGTVVTVDPVGGGIRWRRDIGVLPTAVAGDGTLLLVGTADGQVVRLDSSGQEVSRLTAGPGPVLGLVAGRPAAALLGDRLVGLDPTG